MDININIKEEKPVIIGVCHPAWRGIRSSTYGFTSNVIEVPVIESGEEADEVADKILAYEPKKIFLNGYPRGYNLLAKSLKTKNPSVRIFFISHAPFTWYTDRLEELFWLKEMFTAYDERYIEKIGFVKKDPAVYFKQKGMNANFLMNRLPKFENFQHVLNADVIRVGIWGSHLWHRNLLNQAVGALMVEGTEIHLNELPDYFFLDEKRVTRHGILPKEQYTEVMRTMDINMYVSFTECFPMTVIESMAQGIPCIVSDTSEVYSWSEYLKRNLIVNKIDSPIAIAERIREVLRNYEKIQEEYRAYLPVLNGEIEKSIVKFFE